MALNVQNKFQETLVKGIRQRLIPNKNKESRDWYRSAALDLTDMINKRAFIKQGQDGVVRKKVTPSTMEIGSMYLYNYDPKWKKELPVYDTFPLVFPFNMNKKYIWGMNMHYLPPYKRAELMDLLYTITTDKRYNRSTKLKLSWQVLKNLAKSDLYEPTIHCYLKSHIKSQVKLIDPVEWDYVLMLKLQQFRGPEAWKYQHH